MCDRPCQAQDITHFDVASVMVEYNGELHTMNFRTLLQPQARREEGGKSKWQAVDTLGWHEEIARQAGSGSRRTRLRAHAHGELRGQADLREDLVERSRGCVEFVQRMGGCASKQGRVRLAAG